MFIDAFGQTHARAGTDARIVCLVPSITELLFDLDLDERIVGRTGFCVHPEERVANVPKLGGTKDVKLDELFALEPTHVVVNIDENTRPLYDALKQRVPNVVVTHPNAPADNLELFRLLGGIFDCESRAEFLTDAFLSRLERLDEQRDQRPPRRVWYLIWREPWMSVSADTYVARTLALVNWQIMASASDDRYPQISDRELGGDADLVLLSSEPYPFRDKHLDEVARLRGDAAGVRLVDGEMLSWYGSRAIAGLDYLARLADDIVERAA